MKTVEPFPSQAPDLDTTAILIDMASQGDQGALSDLVICFQSRKSPILM